VAGRWIKAAEAADRLGVSISTVYRMAESGELVSIRVGRSVRIGRQELEAWITERTKAAVRVV